MKRTFAVLAAVVAVLGVAGIGVRPGVEAALGGRDGLRLRHRSRALVGQLRHRQGHGRPGRGRAGERRELPGHRAQEARHRARGAGLRAQRPRGPQRGQAGQGGQGAGRQVHHRGLHHQVRRRGEELRRRRPGPQQARRARPQEGQDRGLAHRAHDRRHHGRDPDVHQGRGRLEEGRRPEGGRARRRGRSRLLDELERLQGERDRRGAGAGDRRPWWRRSWPRRTASSSGASGRVPARCRWRP